MSTRTLPMHATPGWRDWLWPGLAAMATYACMYAFRKPFAAAAYEQAAFAGLDYKVWLVMAQTIGYAGSKFVGIGLIARLRPDARQPLLLGIVGGAWLSWLGFALLPAALRWPMLFCNGLLLGLVWGVVFSYLEGRRGTEAMAALLAASLIFSSAMAKAVGKQLLLLGVDPAWMPFACAALYLPLLLLCMRQLARLPPPDIDDHAARTARKPLGRLARRRLLRQFLPGLAPLAIGYVVIAVLREVRDNFEADLLVELGHGGASGLFLWLELPATLAALVSAATLVRLRDHACCLFWLHGLMLAGLAGVLGATLLFSRGALPPLVWIALTGLCLSMAYVPFNCAFFERLIATFRIRGNVGFFAYLLDTVAYFGSCTALFASQWSPAGSGWVQRFATAAQVLPLAGIAGTAIALWFFHHLAAARVPPVSSVDPSLPMEHP
ncbi:MAG TPA: DUF5690 family protein [Stenotrophomonas sp.]|nr:DUF5690 family protein [Stenotrophomonas sp.]